MKHIDKTPYRSESGEINIINRVQGMLKYGMSWYDRVKAQDIIAATFGKQLGGQFILLQNIVLPDTEIDLPLVLIGPPGIFLINALHERGVYMARDDEWGTLTGDTFVPARINQVKRAITMGRVLQVYLERLGYKGLLVENIVMSADPGLHIDSTRPAVRVVMSDAIDRFALSLTQARGTFDLNVVAELERVILTGKGRQAAVPAESPDTPPVAGSDVFIPGEGGSGELEFSFQEEPADPEVQSAGFSGATSEQDEMAAAARSARAKKPRRKKIMGLTPAQLGIVVALLLCWLCSLLAFAGYYFYSIGWIQFA
jgi:hypothetical protein